jgi:predicted RNA binding protein YcfA (HicA-like mRNA interferase family)
MKSSQLVRIFQRDGWIIVSQKGSHLRMEHPVKQEVLFVPFHGSYEMGKGLARKLLKKTGLIS